jgi:type IV pilus assembly protein PilB
MQPPRIGESLRSIVPLTAHDIEEILAEQKASGRRFGDIAIAFGLCEPAHVWRALSSQAERSSQTVDLDTFGVDTQAVAHMPAELAWEAGVIPIRIIDDTLLVAVSQALDASLQARLSERTEKHVVFVLAPEQQILRAIAHYYSAAFAA